MGMTVFGFSLVAMVTNWVPTVIIFFWRPIPNLCKGKNFQIQASTLNNSPHVKIPLTQCYFLKNTHQLLGPHLCEQRP